jgi:integrase
MKLSDLIPVASEHLWAGSKDEARTIARAERLVMSFNPDLDDTWIPLVALRALQTFSPGSRCKYRASLSSLLKAYRLLGGPRLELPPPFPASKARDRVLTAGEVSKLYSSSMGLIALVLIETGMRISELYRAEVIGDFIYLKDTKNGSSRTIPITERLANHLRGEGLLSSLIHLRAQRTMRRLWADEVHAQGLPGVTFHCLRHTAITGWAESGLSLQVIMALAGHRDVQTSMRYTHLSPQALAASLASL